MSQPSSPRHDRRHADADEHEPDAGEPAAPCERADRACDGEGAREGGERDDRPRDPADEDRGDRGEARAAGDAEQVGARERVAQGRLEQGAAEAERRRRR